MGKPQVSFSKRQREQAKRERQQLKMERRAERSSIPGQGTEISDEVVREEAIPDIILPAPDNV